MAEYTKIGRIRPVFRGAWDSAADYTILDIVRSSDGAAAYAALKDVPAGTPLSNAGFWQAVVDVSGLSAGGSGNVSVTADSIAAALGYVPADAEDVRALEFQADAIPDYWQAELEAGAKAINTALMNAGADRSAFLFYTDAHWTYGSGMSPALLKHLSRNTAMTKIFYGGDIVDAEGGNYEEMAYLWQWRSMVKDLPNHHSVPGNHDAGTANAPFGEKAMYGFLLAAEETPDVSRGDGLYYFIDSPPEKTRYLFLDTGFSGYNGLDDGQTAFVNSALLSTPDGWHIVAIAHKWHDVNYDVSPPVPGAMSAAGSQLLGTFDAYNSRSGDFAGCGGWVEFCIGGHAHCDYDSASEGGIPVILVETDSFHVRSGLSAAEGTTGEASVNGIIADYDAKKIHVVRIGRGESRDVDMTWSDRSWTNVLDTVGWQENRRVSASSNYEERDNAGSDLTGYIPVKPDDVVRLKNITMPASATDYTNYVYWYDADKVGTGSIHMDASMTKFNPVFDDAENVIGFTVYWDAFPNSSTGFVRINAADINESSVITVNEEIG